MYFIHYNDKKPHLTSIWKLLFSLFFIVYYLDNICYNNTEKNRKSTMIMHYR